jgi:hypothetical protein
MASSATLTITYANVAGFPAGSVVDHIKVTCTGTTTGVQPVLSLPSSTASATYTVPGPDTYTFTAQGFPLTGGGFGTPVSATLTITSGTTVSLSLPAAMTVS